MHGYMFLKLKKRWTFFTTLLSMLRSVSALCFVVGAEWCNLTKYRLVSLFLDFFENSKECKF